MSLSRFSKYPFYMLMRALLTAFLLQKLNNWMSFNLIGQRDKDAKELLSQSAESLDWGVIEKKNQCRVQ